MSAKRGSLVILVASLLGLAIGVGPDTRAAPWITEMWGADAVQALAPASRQASPGTAIPYLARLSDQAGRPVAEGSYDFTFALYKAESGGEPLWAEVQDGVMVRDGAFAVSLGNASLLPATLLSERALWLAVGVRGPGETGFTALTPRQRVSATAPAAPASPTGGVACPHDHLGETWTGDVGAAGLQVENTQTALKGVSSAMYSVGVEGWNTGSGSGVSGTSLSGYGVYGSSANSDGVRGEGGIAGSGVVGTSEGHVGVYGYSGDSPLPVPDHSYGVYGVGEEAGVQGESTTDGGTGVYGYSSGSTGQAVYGYSSGSSKGVYGYSATGIAVLGRSDHGSGVRGEAYEPATSGVYGWNNSSGSGVTGNSASGTAISAVGTGKIYSAADSVLYLSPHDMVVREVDKSVVSVTGLDNGGVRIRNLAGAGSVTRYLSIPVSTFGTLFGSPLYVKSLEVCYKSSSEFTFIDYSGVFKNRRSDTGWDIYLAEEDNQASMTYTCYPVTATTRLAVDSSTWVQFNIVFNGTGSTFDLEIYSVTLTLTENQS